MAGTIAASQHQIRARLWLRSYPHVAEHGQEGLPNNEGEEEVGGDRDGLPCTPGLNCVDL